MDVNDDAADWGALFFLSASRIDSRATQMDSRALPLRRELIRSLRDYRPRSRKRSSWAERARALLYGYRWVSV